MVAVPITLNDNGGSGGDGIVYHNVDTGGKYSDIETQHAIASVRVPQYPRYKFLGYFSAATGGTKYINSDGSFTSAFYAYAPTAPVTLYAQWSLSYYIVTVDSRGGAGGESELYAKAATGGIYSDTALTNAVTFVTPPTLVGNRFLGYFSAATGGTKYIEPTGQVLPSLSSLVPTSDFTLFAQWSALYTITLDKRGGSGGSSGLWYDSHTQQYYADETFVSPVTNIVPPTRAGNTFLGYFTAATGGVKYINADGSFASAFVTPTSNFTLFAQWDTNALVLYLDAAGGIDAPDCAYFKNGGWYADERGLVPMPTITVPTRNGYVFGGYKDGDGNTLVTTEGVIVPESISADAFATAQWTAMSFVLSFDYNGGTEGIASKSVTMGQPIGELPTTTRDGKIFVGWKVANRFVDELTAWDFPANMTARAEWTGYVGFCFDWFGLASDALVPIRSDAGDNKQRLCVSHIGRYEPNVNQTSGVWRNPSVTYAVKRNTTIMATLGQAFPATIADGMMKVSGYMVTDVRVETLVGQFPTVTVSAVANEGANAINLFNVSIPVIARSKAQALLGCVAGGGYLQRCAVTAHADPVVVAENMMPCASDVVNGVLMAEAMTIAPNLEDPPIAGGGFTSLGEPRSGAESTYQSWSFTAQKEL